jgi:hypothetical protein
MDDRTELQDLLRAVGQCTAAAPLERRKHLDGTIEAYAFDQRTDWGWGDRRSIAGTAGASAVYDSGCVPA